MATGWQVIAQATSDFPGKSVTVYVICGAVAP
jgi:hypothetical protein